MNLKRLSLLMYKKVLKLIYETLELFPFTIFPYPFCKHSTFHIYVSGFAWNSHLKIP